MDKDIRREQLALLRFEKQLAGLAASFAAGSAMAAAAAQKMGLDESLVDYREVEAALLHLAEVTSKAHASAEAAATEAGLAMLQATGGVPKDERRTFEAVQSLLGLG